jgi:hypothetical protein
MTLQYADTKSSLLLYEVILRSWIPCLLILVEYRAVKPKKDYVLADCNIFFAAVFESDISSNVNRNILNLMLHKKTVGILTKYNKD